MAAASRSRSRPAPDGPGPAIAVLVPAHDEAGGIAECLRALAAATGPGDSVVVVADNCTDGTAEVARQHGVTVLERRDPRRRGKGHALNWALERLDGPPEAIAFVDADCVVSPGFLDAVRFALAAGENAVQVPYVVGNLSASTATALRRAAFALINVVRPLGRSRLGLSAGVLGTGMAFEGALIRRFGFDTDSLVEDADLNLRLVLDGHRVAFAPDASVSSPMPTAAEAIHAQQSRWEGGRWDLVRRHVPALLGRAVRRRDPAALSAVFELCVPPTALLGLAHGAGLLAGLAAGGRARRLGVLTTAMHTAYVLGGLRVAGEPRETFVALLGAPVLVLQKLKVFGDMAVRGAPSEWERTAREPSVSAL